MLESFILALCEQSPEPGLCTLELAAVAEQFHGSSLDEKIIKRMLKALSDDFSSSMTAAHAITTGGECNSEGCTVYGRKGGGGGGGGGGYGGHGGGGGSPSGPSGPGFSPSGGGGWGNITQYAGATDNYCTTSDPDISGSGAIATVNGNNVIITPRSSSVPDVTVPNAMGADGFTSSNLNDHVYNVYTATPGLNASPQAVGDAIAANPTPGSDSPATAAGTRNNAGDIPFTPIRNNHYVQSFRIASPDTSRFTDITVNYTIEGEHSLHEGYVIRYGIVDGSGNVSGLRSYGEGHAWMQDPNPVNKYFWCNGVQDEWGRLHQETITILAR